MHCLLIVLLLGIHINFLFPDGLMAQSDVCRELKDRTKISNLKKISKSDLKDLLKEHNEKLKDMEEKINWGELDSREATKKRECISRIGRGHLNETNLKEANLSGENLEGAYLNKTVLNAKLVRSNFEGAYIIQVKLVRHKNLREINLQNAILRNIDLSEATLTKAKLRGAKFLKVCLKGAKLNESDLTGATFENVDLSDAELKKTDLTGAEFINADLTNVVYEPKAGGQPDIQSISQALNLQCMTYTEDRSGLVSLRDGFKKMGFRKQEQDITYALKRRDTKQLIEEGRFFEGIAWRILVEWTCEYGRKPGLPLFLMFSVIGICYMFYFVVILFGGKGTVWKVLPQEQRLPDEKTFRPLPVEFTHCTILEVIWYPLYLSLLSTFRIGWRDLNMGTWLSRSLPFEYTLMLRGWVKIIAGFQSVVCVYLLALSILTYFGRPFE